MNTREEAVIMWAEELDRLNAEIDRLTARYDKLKEDFIYEHVLNHALLHELSYYKKLE